MSIGATLLAPQPLAAMIAGGFLALGWVFTHALTIRRDRSARAERVRDVQGALYAEIRVYTDTLESQVLPLYGAQVEGQILNRPGFFPVIPTESNDRIFSAIVEDIHVLPFDVVGPVVRYYYQLSVIAAMVADLRALKLAEIGPERAARMYRHYIEMKIEAIGLGTEAMQFLRAHLNGGDLSLADLIAGREKTRLSQTKAGPEAWLAAEKTRRDAETSGVSASGSPASGRSGQS